MIFTLIQLIAIPIITLVVLRVLGVIGSKQKNFTARTAPLGSRASRIAESAILLCIAAAIYVFTATNTSTSGMLLRLDGLSQELVRVHITAACIVLGLLVVSVLLTCFWRGGVGIPLAAIATIGYGFFLNGGLMDHFFAGKEEILAPKVEYTFQVSGKFSGGEELWVNDVYLGKMPLTMTWEEFSEKVPFMAEPPEGFKSENSRRPKAPWFRFTFWEMKKRDNIRSFYYDTDSQDYYAKVKFNDQWGTSTGGGGGGGGGRWHRKYDYSFYGNFPDREKLIEEENKRLDTLIQKARLNNYTVDAQWWDTFKEFDNESFWSLRHLAIDESGFEKVMDAIARFEYGIPQTVDEQIAQDIYEQICKDADASMVYATGGIEGRAIELIYDQLDVKQLVADCRKALKSNRPLRVSASWRGDEYKDYKTYSHDPQESYHRNEPLPASFSVLRHAIRLWDKKLDIEKPIQDNIIETEITPLYIAYRGNFDAAAGLGGGLFEEYLLRQFRRERRLEGMDLDYEAREYTGGQHLNKWIYHLVQLDSSAGREFRSRNSRVAEKMTQLLIDNMHNSRKEPPEFLFYDLDMGKNSLAVRFWPDYTAAVNDSFPGWDESMLEKRFAYLARMGKLATEKMYMDCWNKVDIKEYEYSRLRENIEVIPFDRRLSIARQILEDVKRNKDQIRYNADLTIRDYENYLICLGDQQAMEELLACEPKEKKQRIDRIKSMLGSNMPKQDQSAIVHRFAQQDDADLRMLTIKHLRELPTPEHVDLLETLAQDMDATVKQAAQATLDGLEQIRQMPYEKLVSLESTYTPPS